MPALANPTQKPTRASFARMLAQLTIGLGLSTVASIFADSAFSQQCDRCANMASPSCGCESENGHGLAPRPCTKCVPKPSLGEMLLNHFDRVGDRYEAKAKKPERIPSCGCESARSPSCGSEMPQSPNCGCESISVQQPIGNNSTQFSPLRTAPPRPFPIDPSQFSNGSIGNNHLNSSSPPIVTISPTQKMQSPAINALQKSPPQITPAPEPMVQKTPFEQRKPATEHNRIPAAETPPTNRYNPNSVKQAPLDVPDTPPSWAPKSSRPDKVNPKSPESNLPDVLVDPFKDDASFHGTRRRMEGILLSNDRQVSTKSLPIAPIDQAESQADGLSPINRPNRFTPAQLSTPSLQFEASDSESIETSKVVSSSFAQALPVKVVARKANSKPDSNELPPVSRIKVPNRR